MTLTQRIMKAAEFDGSHCLSTARRINNVESHSKESRIAIDSAAAENTRLIPLIEALAACVTALEVISENGEIVGINVDTRVARLALAKLEAVIGEKNG